MKAKILCLLLAVLLAVPQLACGPAGGDSETPSSPGGPAGEAETEGPAEEIKEDLPDIAFGGRDFRIIVKSWGEYDVSVDENSSEDISFNDVVINDATYARNLAVSEKYGVNIVKIVREDIQNAVKKSVSAGLDDYELALPLMQESATLALEGHLHDWNALPHLDLNKPWYDQNLRSSLKIKERNYFMMGDFQIRDDDHTWILMFNKQIVRDLGLEEPYGIVREGKWTFDKFKQMIKDASADLNGDGVFDSNDRYGFLTTSAGGVTNFLFSGGEKITDGDPTDGNRPVIRDNADRVAAILEKTVDILHKDNASFIKGSWEVFEKMFIEGRGLFYSEILAHVRRLRAMNADFGVLPCPKYDENQKDYLTHVDPASPIMSLPSTSDPEFVGVVMEALSAESYRRVTPAFYEASLSGKIVRDDESLDMLKIIMGNHVFDFALVFNFGGIGQTFNALAGKGDVGYSSEFEKKLEKANADVDRIWGSFN